jgi:RNA ligase
MLDFNEVERLISEGFITSRKHSTDDLFILNYTARCQYESHWTPETMQCRGLIVDSQRNIVSRPLKKFFNLEELDGRIPSSPFAVYDKLDGSLCISYVSGNHVRLATRGSFESEQAEWANEILINKYGNVGLDTNRYTYCFELIDPRNRIVVDYGRKSDLVLLAIIETETGQEQPIDSVDLPFPRPQKFSFASLDEIVNQQDDEREGFVLKFQTNERIKFKFAEYKRLHKILTQVSSKSIWESLRDGKPLDEILERVPDEFFSWVKKTKADLERQYTDIESVHSAICGSTPIGADRKAIAEYFKRSSSYPSICFSMLDGKNYSDFIWKILRPKFERPFKEDVG